MCYLLTGSVFSKKSCQRQKFEVQPSVNLQGLKVLKRRLPQERTNQMNSWEFISMCSSHQSYTFDAAHGMSLANGCTGHTTQRRQSKAFPAWSTWSSQVLTARSRWCRWQRGSMKGKEHRRIGWEIGKNCLRMPKVIQGIRICWEHEESLWSLCIDMHWYALICIDMHWYALYALLESSPMDFFPKLRNIISPVHKCPYVSRILCMLYNELYIMTIRTHQSQSLMRFIVLS